jgi:hypothetical protein
MDRPRFEIVQDDMGGWLRDCDKGEQQRDANLQASGIVALPPKKL